MGQGDPGRQRQARMTHAGRRSQRVLSQPSSPGRSSSPPLTVFRVALGNSGGKHMLNTPSDSGYDKLS
jgi:hypothetical protein